MPIIPKEIIEKAIQGGWNILGLTGEMTYDWYWRKVWWKKEQEILVVQGDVGEPKTLDYYATALDPNFWKALGKSLGWDNQHCYILPRRFYDLILTRQPTDTFWAELLANK